MKYKIANKNYIEELERKLIDYQGQVEAIDISQAVIEFNMDGTIITANENFLNVIGYQLNEIHGNHHSIFVDNETAKSGEYKSFWTALDRGEYQAKQYKWIGKGGKEIWIEASYNPILNAKGKPFKIVEYATDITQRKIENANNSGQIEAIYKSQAVVVEFTLDGSIVMANKKFLDALGYELNEIQGKHHSMFVESSHAASNEYRLFWANLAAGQYQSGEYMRVAKGGKEVWIQASYNPIMGLDGKPFKVVEFASDVTQQKEMQQSVELLLNEVSRVMTALGSGNLSEGVKGSYTGQFELLKNAINDYCQKISDIVVNIGEASSLVNSDADEISKGNLDLSRRTESQAASMEEMTSTVKQNAANAQEANTLAGDAREQAATGGEVVNKAITAMHEINQASNKISDIIGVIDEIAFQTNLLALNAAVEAARAGEKGRGFAVVATEVRNLAGRSATAAKEIKELIQDSVSKVTDGSHLVNQSGETLEKIMTSVKQVAEIIGDISSASQEQAQGINLVNKAIIDMDTATQQNTAMVEEAAAAAESMSEQSHQLNNLIGFFQVDSASGSDVSSTIERRTTSERPWSKDATKPKGVASAGSNDFSKAAAVMSLIVGKSFNSSQSVYRESQL